MRTDNQGWPYERHQWVTIDVGYVHVLADDGECRPDCPHPSHKDTA